MQTKICSKCGIEKPLEEFGKHQNTKDKLQSNCKCCAKEISAKWYAENPEKKKESSAKYRAENPESSAKWRAENLEKVKESSAKYRGKPEHKKRKNERKNQRRIDDPLYRLKSNLGSGLATALNRIGSSKNGQRSHDIRGCTNEFLKSHIESQFLEGMTWDNFHLWHIDHFIPQASAKNEAELLKLNHWYNLRPLWAVDNLKKSDADPYTLKFELGIVTIIPFLEIDGLFIRNRISNYKRNLSTISESILEGFLNA